jgi:hypothetical protein
MVSYDGRILSKYTDKILSPNINQKGYYQIHIYKDGVRIKKLLHRLVAFAFIPNPENKPCIDHIDGNPSNNHGSNLRWCTQNENLNFPLARKRKSDLMRGKGLGSDNNNFGNKYEKNANSKPIIQFTKKGKFIRKYASAVEAGDSLNKGSYNISRCCNHIQKYNSAYGFKWEFDN